MSPARRNRFKTYRVWDLESKKIVVTRAVNFNEDVLPSINLPAPTDEPTFVLLEDYVDEPPIANSSHTPSASLVPLDTQPPAAFDNSPISPPVLRSLVLPSLAQAVSPTKASASTPLTRPKRTAVQPTRLGNFQAHHAGTHSENEPTFKQTMASADADEWRKAMKIEFDSLTMHQVSKLVPRPSGARVIGGMRLTYGNDGSISLNQSHYLEDTLERSGFEDLNPVKLLLPMGLRLQPGSPDDVAAASYLHYNIIQVSRFTLLSASTIQS
ncbi:hypothetical protein CROQUDRAFT_109620 [Cronartium quercuum f. sp. fusiforme G11]|uniref:Retroviral polymerase SH3-like domain-containing protein n=1 Tax=Cronartium quercuum f. sp. fusiforme G11 TaxID=708437 RepID=A0A9P6T8Q0_9BASI|nr:hypothetical protein CROQUDRAFT_109620 [Cronartium quercuum f. sp. fusiforme G11]